MNRGSVVGLRAQIGVTFRLTGYPDISVDCVLDTGFEGALALPPDAASALQLDYVTELNANLANDTNVRVDVYAATIVWDGVELEGAVLALGRRPLLGTALLEGYRLRADFAGGGLVTIDRM